MVKLRCLAGVLVLLTVTSPSGASAETVQDVLQRAKADALLDRDREAARAAPARAAMRSPVLTGPIRVTAHPQAEQTARAAFENVIDVLRHLPSNEVGVSDRLHPSITLALVSFIERFDGTRAALTARLLLGQIHVGIDSSLDFDFGWSMLSRLGDCGIDCWQASHARGTQSAVILEYARNPQIIRAELMKDLIEYSEFKRLRQPRFAREEILAFCRAAGAEQVVENDELWLRSFLHTYLRLDDLKSAKEIARQLKDFPHRDKALKARAEKWYKRIDEGGNPWKEGLWGSSTIGEGHPPYEH